MSAFAATCDGVAVSGGVGTGCSLPLVLLLIDETRLLQQVLLDLGAFDRPALVEVDVDVLAEARRVVVAQRLRISERCQTETSACVHKLAHKLTAPNSHSDCNKNLANHITYLYTTSTSTYSN